MDFLFWKRKLLLLTTIKLIPSPVCGGGILQLGDGHFGIQYHVFPGDGVVEFQAFGTEQLVGDAPPGGKGRALRAAVLGVAENV